MATCRNAIGKAHSKKSWNSDAILTRTADGAARVCALCVPVPLERYLYREVHATAVGAYIEPRVASVGHLRRELLPVREGPFWPFVGKFLK